MTRSAWLFAPIVACGSRSDLSVLVHDASVDVKGDAIVGGCVHALPPSRPAQDDGSGEIEIYDAVRTMNLGDGKAPLGLDLDETCTCPQPDSCNVPNDAAPRCDHTGGVDDAFGDFIQTISSATSIFQQKDIDAQLTSGAFGLIVRVKNYNGQANDTQVEVAIFASAGTQNGAPPKWDGSDVWTLDPAWLLGGAIAKEPVPLVAYDLNAYVAGSVLVANIGDLPFVLGGVTVRLNAAIVTASIEPSGGSFRLVKGTLAGRWPSSKLITSLQTMRDPSDASLCGTNADYQLLKTRICELRDITQNKLGDDTGAACDAMSFALAFDAVPAKYGAVLASDAGAGCGPSWSDECP